MTDRVDANAVLGWLNEVVSMSQNARFTSSRIFVLADQLRMQAALRQTLADLEAAEKKAADWEEVARHIRKEKP